MLEKILTVKGIPAFESLDEVIASRREGFLDFLYKGDLDFGRFPTLREKAKAFKDGVLKALVVPYLQEEKEITPFRRSPSRREESS